jgi:hypothetical protein
MSAFEVIFAVCMVIGFLFGVGLAIINRRKP